MSSSLIEEFRIHLERERKSEHTIEAYVRSVKKYELWYGEKFGSEFRVFHEENVLSYLSHLKQQRNNKGMLISGKTINQNVNGLKACNQFLIDSGKMSSIIIGRNSFQKIQNSIASPAKFGKVEVDRFFQAILESKSLKGVRDSYRDYTLAKVLGLTGMRISECLSLCLEDVFLEAKEILIRNGKGNKSRTVFINSELHRILSKYLKTQRASYRLEKVSPYLFLSRRSRNLDRKTVNKSFKKYSLAAGLKQTLSPHDFRHYFCSQAIEVGGLGIHEVAALAGHSSITTTSLYTNPSRESMLSKLENL